jgi:hypothetical protein
MLVQQHTKLPFMQQEFLTKLAKVTHDTDGQEKANDGQYLNSERP